MSKLWVSLIFMAFGVSANIRSIDVFTTVNMPVTLYPDYPAAVHLLDAAERMEDAFFGELPADPAQAEAMAKSRISSAEFAQIQSQLVEAYNGLLMAWSLKLTKYPAVVINREDVIYGTTDVRHAITLWRTYYEQ